MIYAGIGSRETPSAVLDIMDRVGHILGNAGWTLRSGGADGADSAFERGARHADAGSIEIYLPWKGFNGHGSQLYGASREAHDMAARFHPNWAACSHGARAMHARNCYQVLGLNLSTPCDLVICWTRGGSGAGGTGQALRIAHHYGIPVHDLGSAATLKMYRDRLDSYRP